MTEMLLEWLNSEVKLSKRVTDIIEDFSSGYLLAEVLHKYEQIPNIHEYKNKSDSESKTHNFRLLDKALRDLEIKVMPKNMKEIHDRRKGAAAKFLYQIKMTLSKKGINFERLLMRNSNQLHSVYTAMKYPTQNEKYRADASKKMVSPLDEKTLTMKKVGIDLTKQPEDKHEHLRLTNEIKVIEERIKEEDYFKEEHERNVSKIHQKEKETHISLVKEDQMAEESWNNNIANMKQWEKNQKKEEMKDVDYFRTKILEAFIKSSKETEIQIDAFDKNLSRLGLDVAVIDTKFKKNPNAMISSEMVMQKIKEKVEKETAAKKEKGRRNRLINLGPSKVINPELNTNLDTGQSNLNPLDSLASAHQKRLEYEKLRELHDRNEKREFKIIQNKQTNSVFENEFGSDSEVVFNPESFLSSLRKENLKFRISELANKKKKKKRDFKLLTSVFDQIMEITESVYDFQQKNNTELIDLSEWRNLMQKFIGGKESEGKDDYFEKEALDSKTKLRQASPAKKLAKNASDLDSVMLGITPEFEENEFLDYVNLKGQWTDSLVPSNALNVVLKITDVVGPEFFEKGNAKPKDVYNYKEVEYEPNDEEIENLTIPEDNCKNYHLGEIIDIVTDIKFPEKQEEVNHKTLFSQVPIKVSLIGHSFSGKKTAAEALVANNPNLKLFNIEELIKRTIDSLDKLEQPLEANPKFKTLKKNQVEQLQNERAVEEEKFKEFKRLILPIRDAIRAGETPEDESLVELLLHYIKLEFPERDSNLIHEEILKKAKRKKEVSEELAKIKEEQAKKPKAKAKEETTLLAELAKISAEANKGFIIVDFPRNVNQAMILENKLSGYVQDIDKPTTQLQEDRDNFAQILDKSLKPPSGKSVRAGGLQMMVQLNVASKECIRRAAGRRQDPTTGLVYHLEDNPPPANDHKLNERLLKLEEPSESKLPKQHEYFDLGLPSMKVFYDAFGFSKSDLKFFNCIEGGTSKETVHHELVEFVSKLQKLNEEKEGEIVSKEKALHNSENQSNANNNSFFVEPKELQSRETVDRNVDLFNVQSTEGDDEWVRYCKKLEEARKKLNMNTVESIYSNWTRLYESFFSESKQVFKFFKKQREKLVTNFTRLQGKFTDFLKRPSRKVEEANKCLAKYNKFAEDYPELLDDAQVKEEFHQDVVDLSDRIWEVIDLRKNEAIEELKKIMTSGWIEREMGKFYSHLETLFLLEAEKLIQVLTILRMFYNGMDNKFSPINSNILTAMKSNDILIGTTNFNLESEDESGSSPRVGRLHKNCIKLIFKFDEIVKHLEALLKTATPNTSPDSRKKMTKSFTYRKMQVDSTFLDDKRDIFIFDEELKNSVKNEKNKFKYRVTLLKHWGIDKLKTMRRLATTVFDNMDEWIINSVKAENEAMNSLTDDLKGAIEREMKAKVTTELDRFDVYELVDVPSFFDKVLPEPFKAMVESAKFNLEKFRTIIEEVKSYEVQKYNVRTTTFVDIYFKKYFDSQGLPESIRSLSFHNYTKFIKFFETKSGENSSSGFVNIKYLSTILTLLHCKVLDEPGENHIRSATEPHLFNTGMITKDSFMQIEFPFEKDPSSILRTQDELYESDHDRIMALKEILYGINRDDCGNIALFDFMEILNLKFLNSGLVDEEKSHKTYYEILLFN